MTATKPLTEQTPVEIDTVLYRLYSEAFDLRQRRTSALEDILRQAGAKFDYYNKTWNIEPDVAIQRVRNLTQGQDPAAAGYIVKQAEKVLAKYDDLGVALEANREEQRPLNDEYKRRPWTRAFLVTDGHVHRAMECSTCFPTTAFTWLVDLSGKDEAEIVELAGERACTVCYPTAPTLRSFEKASPLFTEEEAERNRQREIRAAEKAERLAKKIAKGLTHDGSEFVVVTEEGTYGEDYYNARLRGQHYTRREHFKTEQAAVQWVVRTMASKYRHENTETMIKARQAIIEAVATKHGKTVEQVSQEIDAKVQAKIKRDNRGY